MGLSLEQKLKETVAPKVEDFHFKDFFECCEEATGGPRVGTRQGDCNILIKMLGIFSALVACAVASRPQLGNASWWKV